MSSSRGVDQFNKGKKIIKGSSLDVDQLNQAVQDVSLDSCSKASSKRNKNKTGNGYKFRKPNPWGQSAAQRTGGRGNVIVRPWATTQAGGRYCGNNYNPTSNAIPLSGWNWNSRPGRRATMAVPQSSEVEEDVDVDVDDHNCNDELYESDDELDFDDYDSDENHDRKNNRWYADFFETLDSLTVDQINEPTRQWHCPACQNGPGAIDWYCSLQALVAHTKTKGSKRVKIHRDLAEILEEELKLKGATLYQAGKSHGQWKGLNGIVENKEIVWPPMVIIMNTRLEQDDNQKWVGMGNPELLDYFSSYEAVKACHSYGPKGHMGMSVLIFESSAVGYSEAERLSKHFENEGTDKIAWNRHRVHFFPGGKRKLYGYMATKEDMDMFNKHSKGKSKLRFELVSYQEKVVDQMKQMNEENQQLHWYKDKEVKHQMHAKALEETIGLVSEKLRKKEIEDRIKKERTQQHCEQLEEELDLQEKFFKDQLKLMQDASNAKDYTAVDPQREEKLEEIKEFGEEREKLKSIYEKKKIELEKWFYDELTRLTDKFTLKN